jgi:hypothetical protein
MRLSCLQAIWSQTRRRFVAIVTIATACIAVGCKPKEPQGIWSYEDIPPPQPAVVVPWPLTIRETIAICYTLPRYHLLAAANPEAREYVRRVASQAKDDKASDYALQLLGFIGNEEDVQFCLDAIESEFTKATARTRRTDNAFWGLSKLAERNIGTSRERLEKMATVQYWKDSRFDAYRSEPRASGFAFETTMMAILALSDAGSPATGELAKRASEEIAPGKRIGALSNEYFQGRRESMQREMKRPLTDKAVRGLNAIYNDIDPAEIERLGLPQQE